MYSIVQCFLNALLDLLNALLQNVISGQGSALKELHFVGDNFSAHKHKDVMEWVEAHKTVHFHFTPTHASWLNQIELWFSILARQLLSKRDFKSVEDLTMQRALAPLHGHIKASL